MSPFAFLFEFHFFFRDTFPPIACSSIHDLHSSLLFNKVFFFLFPFFSPHAYLPIYSRVPSDPFIAMTRLGFLVHLKLRSFPLYHYLFNFHCVSVMGGPQNVLASGHDFTGNIFFFSCLPLQCDRPRKKLFVHP